MNGHIDRTLFDPEEVRRVGRMDLAARLVARGFYEGARRSRRRGFSTEFSEFRPYVSGDDPRHLDWRVYARTDRLFVRRFEAETDAAHVLLVDATKSMAWRWEDSITKLQYAANVAAAVALVCSEAGDRVGVAADDAGTLHVLPPRCRRRQLDRIFGLLEGLEPGGGACLARLAGAAAAAHGRGVFLLCSDFEEDEAGAEGALESLSGAEARVFVLHILHRAEEELPFPLATHLEDSETGRRMAVDVPSLRGAHARAVAAFRARWRARCERRGFTYVAASTATNYVDVLGELAAGR